MKFFAITIFSILLAVHTTDAQNIQDLQKRRQKTVDEISYTNKLLTETDRDAKVTLNRLEVLNQQITLRNRLLSDYDAQLGILQLSISDNQFIVECMSEDLEKIRTDYANLVKQAYRNRSNYNQLVFLLASDNFNQAYKRLLYTRQLARHRQNQIQLIEAIKDIQQKKIEDLSKRKKEQEEVLNKQKIEYSRLNSEKSKQSDYHQQLQKRERELRQLLRKQRQVEENLQKEIERLIAEEAKRAAKQGQTPQEKQLSGDFEKNKGNFPWPVKQGLITDKFGEHPHPVMRNIIIRNNGIDITTSPNEKARAIFGGTISRVFAIPGGHLAVIIRHGQYITVYSNLKDVMVKQGDQVNTLQEIGTVYTDANEGNKTVLKFQIWKENVKLNPEVWITK